ncbi:MAG: hypothetical protein ABGX16_20100 [Pirellulales bacterium]
MIQNEKLFARISAVYEGTEAENLTQAEKRLLENQYKSFVRRGARLSASPHISPVSATASQVLPWLRYVSACDPQRV